MHSVGLYWHYAGKEVFFLEVRELLSILGSLRELFGGHLGSLLYFSIVSNVYAKKEPMSIKLCRLTVAHMGGCQNYGPFLDR